MYGLHSADNSGEVKPPKSLLPVWLLSVYIDEFIESVRNCFRNLAINVYLNQFSNNRSSIFILEVKLALLVTIGRIDCHYRLF